LKIIFGYGFDELIDKLLDVDPWKRPNCSEALLDVAEIKAKIESDY